MGRHPKTQKQSDLDKKIGARLKLVRSQLTNTNGKKVTQSQFAERYNTTEQTVRMWEKGVYTIPDEILLDLSEFIGVDFDFLKCKYDTPNLNESLQQWDNDRKFTKEDVAQWSMFADYCKFIGCDIDTLILGSSLDFEGDLPQEKEDDLNNFFESVNNFITTNFMELKKRWDV